MTTLTFRGFPACSCLVTWLPMLEERLRLEGVLDKLPIAQLIGTAKQSAATHSTGGAADLWTKDPRVSLWARRMGAVSWPRLKPAFDDDHTHLVLIGCVHAHPEAKAQIAEAYAGGDGLLGDAPDDSDLHAALFPKRDWRAGIAYHQALKLQAKRIEKLRKARARRAKYRRWVKKTTRNINRLKGLIQKEDSNA